MGAASAPPERAFGRLEDTGAERVGQGPAALRFDQLVERFGDRLAFGPRAGQAHRLAKRALVKCDRKAYDVGWRALAFHRDHDHTIKLSTSLHDRR